MLRIMSYAYVTYVASLISNVCSVQRALYDVHNKLTRIILAHVAHEGNTTHPTDGSLAKAAVHRRKDAEPFKAYDRATRARLELIEKALPKMMHTLTYVSHARHLHIHSLASPRERRDIAKYFIVCAHGK